MLNYGQKTIFKMAAVRHLEFYGSNNGFFEKPMSFYWSSIETIALDIVFEKIAFFCMHFGDRQTNKQIDRQPHRVKPPSLSRAAA